MSWLLVVGGGVGVLVVSAVIGTLIGKAICLANDRERTR